MADKRGFEPDEERHDLRESSGREKPQVIRK